MNWLRKLEFKNPVDQLTFKEYLNEVTRLMDGACQEFCVIEFLLHSLTLSPKTMENWLRASPQFLIG